MKFKYISGILFPNILPPKIAIIMQMLCPYFSNFIMKLLKILNQNSKNQHSSDINKDCIIANRQ